MSAPASGPQKSVPQNPVPQNPALKNQVPDAASGTPAGDVGQVPSRPRRPVPITLWVGGFITALVVLAAVVSLFWTPYDPVAADASQRLLGSSGSHWLGTDKFGRDVASQLMAGARVTLVVGAVSVGIALLIGTPLGIIAGLRRGWAEELVLRFSDLLLAFPALLLAIIFAAVFGAGTVSAMVAIGIGSIPGFARVARAATLRIGSEDFISAARSSGRGGWAIGVMHVLPNLAGLLLVQSTVTFSLAVLAEAALSYLGLGTPPPDPSWGRMLQESQQFLELQPMLTVWPGVVIALTVLGLNLLGDGLRDRLSSGRDGR